MDFFAGQIIPMAISYAPKQTAFCQGQMIPVNQNQALFALLGTAYGGTGAGGTFGVPNAAGNTFIGFNIAGGQPVGNVGGEANHTLTTAEMPSHTHALYAVTGGTELSSAVGNLPGTSNNAAYAAPSNPMVGLGAAPLATVGGGQAHANMQPSIAINFVIVLYGTFPQRP